MEKTSRKRKEREEKAIPNLHETGYTIVCDCRFQVVTNITFIIYACGAEEKIMKHLLKNF